MKNLANCKPSEFLTQTNKIRKSVYKWLSITDVMNIRRNKPKISEDMTDDEVKKAYQDQIKHNINAMFDSILDEHPNETLELLALLCFVDPSDVDNYPIRDYLTSFNELLNDEAVISFFMSLAELGRKTT